MDDQLRNLIRLNEKRREYIDNNRMFVGLSDFTFIDLEEDIPEPITIEPVSSSRGEPETESGNPKKEKVRMYYSQGDTVSWQEVDVNQLNMEFGNGN